MTDPINPDHYQRDGVECIDAIKAATSNLEGPEAYCTGNAIKYLWRWNEKGGKTDLRKAMWYINDMIAEIEDAEFQDEIQRKL